MKGVKAAVKSPRTPAHLKPHLQNRLATPSTIGQGDDQVMRAAEESLAQEAMSGGLKRTVSRRGRLQLDEPHANPLIKRAMVKGVSKTRRTPSAFMGDFGGRPKGI
jgi:hypothetical protein